MGMGTGGRVVASRWELGVISSSQPSYADASVLHGFLEINSEYDAKVEASLAQSDPCQCYDVLKCMYVSRVFLFCDSR
jgi:hypothetical protein